VDPFIRISEGFSVICSIQLVQGTEGQMISVHDLL